MSLLLAALVSFAHAADVPVRDLAGHPVALGPRPIVFWSTSCDACVTTLAAYARAGEPVVAVNVDPAPARSTLLPFLAARGLSPSADLVVVADPTGDLARRFEGGVGRALAVAAIGADLLGPGGVAGR